MKKFLITILIAVIIGGVFGYFAYKKISQKTTTAVPTMYEEKTYAIQAGVFTSYDNALILADKYAGIIVPDNDKYRVYLAITAGTNNLGLLKNYYDELGVSYYVKEITTPEAFNNTLTDYDALLNATTKENYGPIINDILKEYQKELT